MTKADLVERIQAEIGLSRRDAIELTEETFDIIKSTLESGEPLKISGFGSFTVRDKAARRGRNPQTGEAITLKERRVLVFKSSPVLRDIINGERT